MRPGASSTDCVFCRIAAHEAPATIRFEDDDLVAFDSEPKATPLQDVFHLHWHVMSGVDMGHAAGIAFSRQR